MHPGQRAPARGRYGPRAEEGCWEAKGVKALPTVCTRLSFGWWWWQGRTVRLNPNRQQLPGECLIQNEVELLRPKGKGKN